MAEVVDAATPAVTALLVEGNHTPEVAHPAADNRIPVGAPIPADAPTRAAAVNRTRPVVATPAEIGNHTQRRGTTPVAEAALITMAAAEAITTAVAAATITAADAPITPVEAAGIMADVPTMAADDPTTVVAMVDADITAATTAVALTTGSAEFSSATTVCPMATSTVAVVLPTAITMNSATGTGSPAAT